MALSHAQFWKLTPFEFFELLRGLQDRMDEVWFREAWVVCHITAPHMRRPYQLDRLLSFRTKLRGEARFKNKDDARREYQEVVALVQGTTKAAKGRKT